MRPFLLIIDGPMGSGKTAAAKFLYERFPRTALLGMDRVKWFISGFTRNSRNNAIVNDMVLSMAGSLLRNGINVIVEQGFKEGLAEKYQRLGASLHCRTITIKLIAPRNVLLARVRARRSRRGEKAHPAVAWTRVLRNMRLHEGKRPVCGALIDTSAMSPEQVAKVIVRLMKR